MFNQEEIEIFEKIANSIVLAQENEDWNYAVLVLKVIEDSVRFMLHFHGKDGEAKSTKIKNAFATSLEVLKLHELTSKNPNYVKWNTAVFTLQANLKFKIEYSWDQDLQDQLDRAKNG